MGCVASQEAGAGGSAVSAPTRAETADPTPALVQEPTYIDSSHFQAIKILGNGGYGTVYKVKHLMSGRYFALKTLDKRFTLARSFRLSQALAERTIMSRVSSPFLLPLHCAFQDEDDLFIVMPVMEGGDLSNFVQTVGLMTEKMCQFYAGEILMALKSLNDMDIVFRDLKPSNVLMDLYGHVKLSDYGLAVDLHSKGPVEIAGTAGYMAPEILLKKSLHMSADIWTFGVTLYKLLTGHRPFKSTRSIMQDPVPFHHEVAAGLSPVTKDLLKRLLVKDPSKRLGAGSGGWEEVMAHPFFIGLPFEELHLMKAPWVPSPELVNPNVGNIRDDSIDMDLGDEDQKLFLEWDYNTVLGPSNAVLWDPNTSMDLDSRPVPPPSMDQKSSNAYLSTEPPTIHGAINLSEPSQNIAFFVPGSESGNSSLNSMSDQIHLEINNSVEPHIPESAPALPSHYISAHLSKLNS